MDNVKIQQARATAVSLRGELMALPSRLITMSDGDLKAKLANLGEVAANLADILEEIQEGFDNSPSGVIEALSDR